MSSFSSTGFPLIAIASLSLAWSSANAQSWTVQGSGQDGQRAAAPAATGFRSAGEVAPQAGQARPVRVPGAYRFPQPRNQLNACRRSRPAFGDADFSFHGFDDAGIPC